MPVPEHPNAIDVTFRASVDRARTEISIAPGQSVILTVDRTDGHICEVDLNWRRHGSDANPMSLLALRLDTNARTDHPK